MNLIVEFVYISVKEKNVYRCIYNSHEHIFLQYLLSTFASVILTKNILQGHLEITFVIGVFFLRPLLNDTIVVLSSW